MSAGTPAKEQERKILKHKGVNSALHLAFNASRFEVLRAYTEGWSDGSKSLHRGGAKTLSVQQLKALHGQAAEYVDERMGQKL